MGHDSLNNPSFYIKKQDERTEALSSAPSNKQKREGEGERGGREGEGGETDSRPTGERTQ